MLAQPSHQKQFDNLRICMDFYFYDYRVLYYHLFTRLYLCTPEGCEDNTIVLICQYTCIELPYLCISKEYKIEISLHCKSYGE